MPDTPVRVLLADNRAEFLASCAEFLENCGYHVVTAGSLQAARDRLADSHLHVAILDMRLSDDEDDKDFSGLDLAKESSPAVLKIILTAYKTVESVREAMAPTSTGPPPAFYYVSKQEGLEFLQQQLERAVQALNIDWNLSIDWQTLDPYSLFRRFMPENAPSQSPDNCLQEASDLLRRCFRGKHEIRFRHQLWQLEGRAALLLNMFPSSKVPESAVLVCGGRATIQSEAGQFTDLAPKRPHYGVPTLSSSGFTTHFGANAYVFEGGDLQNGRPLTDVYRHGPEKLFNSAVTTLLEKTLPACHQNTRLVETRPLNELYRLRSCPGVGLPRQFRKAVTSLTIPAATLSMQLRYEPDRLSIRLADQEYSCPDPLKLIETNVSDTSLVFISPGRMDGETIWTDADGNPFVTNLLAAGHAPVLANFVELEAAVRYDQNVSIDLEQIRRWESRLSRADLFHIPAADVEPAFRKALKAILLIRRHTAKLLDQDTRPYHLGMLFEVVRRICHTSLAPNMTSEELRCGLHLVIGAVALSMTLSAPRTSPNVQRTGAGIRLDPAARAVWLDGVQKSLTAQSYQVLSYLNANLDKICSLEDLVVHALGERSYNDRDRSQTARLTQAIHRLRQILESDPKYPRYLRREGVGYRLYQNPAP